jgi:hypothetical protein
MDGAQNDDAQNDGYRRAMTATGGLAVWTLGWLVTLAVARFGPEWWGENPVASWIAVAVNVIAGIGWVVAHVRFLRASDELQRKILLDALAITLGVGWIAGFAYVVADAAGLIPFEVGPAVLPVVLAVVYLLAVLAGRIRYR